MKKFIILILMLLITGRVFSQPTYDKTPDAKYLIETKTVDEFYSIEQLDKAIENHKAELLILEERKSQALQLGVKPDADSASVDVVVP